ncbi:3-oxoadipate enol-lactonase [Rhizobium mongolense]|uniref:3-oxoadipate enol-lactonase n=1 Tax=Rhizobium mongolense TaxID=57676 RepID=UPI0034A1FE4E
MEFISANGISMSVDISGAPNKPAVMFGNSLAADMEMWRASVSFLESDFTILRYDGRGHGASEATSGDYSLDLLGRDALSILDALGFGQIHYVGLSLGGMVGQWLAVNARERLKSLTLCATFSQADWGMWDERVTAVRSSGVAPMLDGTLQRWLTASFRQTQLEETDRVREMILRTSVDGYAGSAAAIRDMEISDYPSRIDLPTLLVAGDQDPSAPPELMRKMHEQISGSEFSLIEDSAHVFTVEQPEQTANIIGRFLRGREDFQ